MDLHEKWRNLVASLDDKSPKIKIVVGVVGLIGAGVAAAIAATKIKEDVVEETKDFENIKKVRMSAEHPEECTEEEKVAEDIAACYSDRDYAKDIVGTSLRYGWKVVKRFGIPIVMAAASTILIFNGANVLSTRLAGTVEALATVTSAYSNYRQGIIERYGEKVDEELRLGLKEQTITLEETITDEDGNEKVVKKKEKAKVDNGGLPSMFARYIDESCGEYVPNITQMEMFAEAQETLFTDMLKRGTPYITLGEIYKAFLIPQIDPKTGKNNYGPETLVMGVVYDESDDPNSDKYVDLRCQRVFYMDGNGRYKAKLLIDPNVSYIYDKLPKALGYTHEKATV